MFYPAEPTELRALVMQCLHAAQPAPTSAADHPPKLLVVPHAGYEYSGPVAGHAYAALAPWRGRIRRVVLLGPAHRVAVRGLAMPAVAAFDTPLGRVPLDRTSLTRVAALPQVVCDDLPHAHEHSLEVQLPFLQAVLGDFTLAPLVVGDAQPSEVAEVLEELWGGEETLIVISSDLSHYLPSTQAREIDHHTVQRLLALDGRLTPHEACGAHALNGAIIAARRHGLKPHLLDLRNSGDTAGGPSRVVGYAALAFEQGEPVTSRAGDASGGQADEHALGRALLAAARNAIARSLNQPLLPEPDHPALHANGACFVTLRTASGELRGCIGRLEARRALIDDVRANARAAAFDDSRFLPVTADEWPGLQLDVSVLQPLQPFPVASEADALQRLRPGEDGVVLEWRGRRATLLPSVWESLPTPLQFMGALKRKAGLAPDFWAPDLQLYRYGTRQYEEAHA